ncbi:hypothetical protein [Alicyclobacillus herbarius]|uniref:hypothetical protein n=1 Tax=Alicyclobacillus herbarius TaxID=122960 RepID=UPI0004148186|nr:hypothetical protein [Alicyclobacillus herbarius]
MTSDFSFVEESDEHGLYAAAVYEPDGQIYGSASQDALVLGKSAGMDFRYLRNGRL